MKNPAYCLNRPAATIPDRPRERLATHGLHGISDHDLVAVILGSGVAGHPVQRLATLILQRLDQLGRPPTPMDLEGIPGLGPARRMQVCAGFELYRRVSLPERRRVSGPADLFPVLSRWADRPQEQFFCVSLNGAHEILACTLVSLGTVNRALVHPREVFAPALQLHAAAVIVAHNHPSGNLDPSPEDHAVTTRLKQAGELLGIPVLDHIIFCPDHWLSFVDRGQF